MVRMVKSCLQSLLKLVNSVIGMVGMGMILYSLWMLRAWYTQTQGDYALPWFIYSFLGLGITFCLITCSGHIAAETANGHCLSCYTVFVFFLVVLEATVTADILLNKNWEQNFPQDPTGRFNDLKKFLESNLEISKWICVAIVVAQALSIILGILIRAIGPDPAEDYDSVDDEYVHHARIPLLINQVQPPRYMVADPNTSMKSDSCFLRINEK